MVTLSDDDQGLIDFAFTGAELALQRMGLVKPVAFLRTGNEICAAMPEMFDLDFSTAARKTQFSMAVNLLSVELRADAVALVSEIWLLATNLDDVTTEDYRLYREIMDRDGSLGDHPKAREAVSVMWQTHEAKGIVQRMIVRRRPDWVELEPAVKPDYDHVEGRFTSMLAPRAMQNNPGLRDLAAAFLAGASFKEMPTGTPLKTDA